MSLLDPTRLDPQRCRHQSFQAKVLVNRIEDVGKFVAEVTVHCLDCGEPFRFLGLDPGFAWDHPTVSIDGLALQAPIEPELERALFSSATLQMPALPRKH